MARFGVIAAIVAPLAAQANGCELLLREGAVVRAQSVVGNSDAGFEIRSDTGMRRLAAGEVIAVLGVPAVAPALPAAHLAGGDVVHGALVGGDATGNRLELLSPVLGPVVVTTDRLAALVPSGAMTTAQLPLPTGVDEALFVRARTGFDVVAGTLHQFGEQGVRFQPTGTNAPRWFRLDEFAALRLRDGVARDAGPGTRLLTRTGDRLLVDAMQWTSDGVRCTLEGGVETVLRVSDLAAASFARDVVFLADLPLMKVEESGHDGEVVHPFRRDQNVFGAPLVTAGRTAAKGFGVHARSRLTFVVPDGVTRFWARVGFDDSALRLPLEPHVDLRVVVDDRVVFERRDYVVGSAPIDIGPLPVRSGGTLTLEVDPGRGRDLGDRINWLLPVLLPAGPRRP